MGNAVKVTVIATGIKPDKMGVKPLPSLSPAVCSAQQSVKSLLARKEKPPVETGPAHVTTEIPTDDLDVPAFVRRRKEGK
jgi:hypothetical protein